MQKYIAVVNTLILGIMIFWTVLPFTPWFYDLVSFYSLNLEVDSKVRSWHSSP